MRRLTMLAALLLLGATVPVVAAMLTQRWVVERKGDTRVVIGPTQMVICDGDRCRTISYAVRISRLEAEHQAALGAVERERIEAAIERMRYNRRKGLQITIPGFVAAAFFSVMGALLLLRARSGLSPWAHGSVRLLACGIAAGLVVFAVVYVDGLSLLPAHGTATSWGASFHLLVLGSLLAFSGGILAGVSDRVV